MAPVRFVSQRQLELLVEFADNHRSIALNSCRNGPLGHLEISKAWEEVSKKLNSIGEGVIKTPEKWKRYWHLLKCRTKGKAADNRRKQSGTGGGPNKMVPLKEIEERIVCIIGQVAVGGVSEVRIPVNLYNVPAETPATSSHTEPEESLEVAITPCRNTLEVHGHDYDVFQQNVGNAYTYPQAEQTIEHQFIIPDQTIEHHIIIPDQNIAQQVPQQASESQQASSETHFTGSAAPVGRGNRTRNRSNHDGNVPHWAYTLEERRIEAEEHVADALNRLALTSEAMLQCQQQLIGLLQVFLSPSS